MTDEEILNEILKIISLQKAEIKRNRILTNMSFGASMLCVGITITAILLKCYG